MSEINRKHEELISDVQLVNKSNISLREKYIQLKRILERNCKEITKDDALQFPSLFSRLVYITQKYNLPRSLEWQLQNIRVKASFLIKNEKNLISEKQYKDAIKGLDNFISVIYDNKIVLENLSQDEIDIETSTPLVTDYIRIQVLNIDKENELIIGKVDDIANSTISIKYNVSKVNEIFNFTIERLWINAQVNLIGSKIDELGYYVPKQFVLEPDYLIDASSLAECFQNYGRSHLHYFRRRFEQISNSQYILLGNLANFFLDEFIFCDNPQDLDFNTTFLNSFKQKPFEFTSCNDIKQVGDFRAFMTKAHTQFNNIKRVITNDFPRNNIDTNKCTLEPSFFCEKYGFQGRLDLLQLSESENQIHQIIELKSGGLPYPKEDTGKIAINHEVQTAIYRLIIDSVFNCDNKKISSAILYSAAENIGENLRHAASYLTLEKEILNIRNLIVATEHDLYIGENNSIEKLFDDIFNLNNYGKAPQFFIDQIADFEKVILKLTPLEKAYLFRYISFISKELYIQKIGDDYYESNSSTASLWNTEFAERQEAFDLISDLEIMNIDDSGRDLKILFCRKSSTDFVNFREGELCILYPHKDISDTVLTNQILKGTIIEISTEHILLRFRYKQKNRHFFEKYSVWAIEHDKLDHSYNNMYKSLFNFLKSPPEKRNILLGVDKPRSTYNQSERVGNNIDEQQDHILKKAISAQDYFLIVGPPGTGKTSIFARRLIEYYHNNTDDNILIIAYTNRAVDELCEAINQAFSVDNQGCDQYIRIGTELSCGENYKHRLLQNIAEKAETREELRNIIQKQRIFIGTLASIIGKPELFDIKTFNIAIIDEASQILEPQIVGLLPLVDKFIMIGDHKQLSTITLQNKEKSQVSDKQLNVIKLYDCSESLFERLFRLSQDNGWEHAYDTLVYQGRMHQELSYFPNKYFYDNILIPVNKWQTEALNLALKDSQNIYQKVVSKKRLAFFNIYEIDNSLSDKVNYKEAEIVIKLSKAIIETYKQTNLNFDSNKTLGIITPYRNQIALIKHQLHESGLPELCNIMVDTVERFQGSQRDIIILSFCINKPYQLDFFCNMNNENNVDRKLNVALTRARQQLFLVGNEYILKQNRIYKELIDSI